MNWVTKNSGSPSTLVDCDKIDDLITNNKFVSLNNIDGEPSEEYLKFASSSDKVAFFHSKNCGKFSKGITFFRDFETLS